MLYHTVCCITAQAVSSNTRMAPAPSKEDTNLQGGRDASEMIKVVLREQRFCSKTAYYGISKTNVAKCVFQHIGLVYNST